MNGTPAFYVTSLLLGVALAMDAFTVSIVNGLNEPGMRKRKMCGIAGTFAFFQALMPMIGWVLVHTLIRLFEGLQKWIPWAAMALLAFLGVRMILEGIRSRNGEEELPAVTLSDLILQGIATSVDALSAGLTFSEYGALQALTAAGIIAGVTFVICMAGLVFGRSIGKRLMRIAPILGGAILIAIGLRILIASFL